MASQNLARLGIVLGLDTAVLEQEISQAQAKFKSFTNDIKRDTNDAAKEIVALEAATKRYGQTLTKEQELQVQFDTGRFKYATETAKQALLDKARAYDKVAQSAQKANAVEGGQQGLPRHLQAALGYQTTDIVTSLAGGQNPMMVLLQQGGQLRDQFGGFKPLFEGIASVVTLSRVAFVGLAGSIAGVGYAFMEGARESKEFNNSLILTGNYAGLTASKFNQLAADVSDKYTVSIGTTRKIMQELVSTGQFTSSTISSLTQSILTISRLSGESVDAVSQKLIPAMDGTANSAKRLNDTYHFLTLEQYKHIEALEKQGKTQEAIQFTTDALNERLNKQKENLGTLEKAWRGLTKFMGDAWDAAKEIGRDKTLEQKLEDAKKHAEAASRAWGESAIATIRARQEVVKLQEEINKANTQATDDSKKAQKQQLLIEDEKKYGNIRKQLRQQINDQIAETEYQQSAYNLEKYKQLELTATRDIAKARNQQARFNDEEAGANRKLREILLAEEIKAINAKLERDKQDLYNETLTKYKDMIKAQKDSIDMEKEKLKLYKENMFATDEELQIAEAKLKLEQNIQKVQNERKLDQKHKDDLIAEFKATEAQKEALIKEQDELKRLQSIHNTVFNSMSNALDTFVKTGKLNFADFTKSLILDLLAIQLKYQAIQMFKGSSLGGMFNQAINFFSGTTSPTAKASGGDVAANEPLYVGENGPEMFVPRGAGTIIPNKDLQNGGTTNVTNNYIQAIDTKSFEQRLLQSSTTIWAGYQYANKSLAVSGGRS